MSLPFPNQSSRRWQCFVCGMEFKEPQEFKGHIVKEHEEGRDYVLCPLKRCGFPVRDVRAHFKARHPQEALPKVGQMRAVAWRDMRDQKAVKRKGPSFKEGFYVSRKNGMKEMHYRSGYEAQVYELLEQHPLVTGYEVEPMHITYWFGGRQRKYYPDLAVRYADGRLEIWEIKPATQTSLPMNEAKWTAATNYCLQRGWHFEVMVEKKIGDLKRVVAEYNSNTGYNDGATS